MALSEDNDHIVTAGRLQRFFTKLKSWASDSFAKKGHTHWHGDISTVPGRGHAYPNVRFLDAAYANVSRCVNAFLPAANVAVEYSTDGGATWSDYGATDAMKEDLTDPRIAQSTALKLGGPSATGSAGDRLRVTFAPTSRTYALCNMVLVLASTNGSGNILCDVENSTVGAPETFSENVSDMELSGWSGLNTMDVNSYTFDGVSSHQHNKHSIRFTFRPKAAVEGCAPAIYSILMYGPQVWSAPHNYGQYGTPYLMQKDMSVVFPAKVTAASYGGLPTATESAAGVSKAYRVATSDHASERSVSIDASGYLFLEQATASRVGGVKLGTTSTTAAAGNHSHSDYAPKASPTFTGTVVVPTPTSTSNTTTAASTAFVRTAINDYAGQAARPVFFCTASSSQANLTPSSTGWQAASAIFNTITTPLSSFTTYFTKTSTSRLTVVKAGCYHFHATLFMNSTNWDTCGVGVFVNGEEKLSSFMTTYGSAYQSVCTEGVIKLTAGQYVEIKPRTASGTTVRFGTSYSHCTIEFLG